MSEQLGPALVVVDSEFLLGEQMLNVYVGNLQRAAQLFVELCDFTLEAAITESEICGVIDKLRGDMTIIGQGLSDLGQALTGKSDAFIQRVNDIDQFIY
jgi:hypothetical protein